MKKINKVIMIVGFLLIVLILVDISLYANAGEIVESVEEQTWLAKQLEIYGVPAGISTAIGFGIGVGLYLLTTKGARKTMGLITGVFTKSTDKLEIANNNAVRLVNQVKYFEESTNKRLDMFFDKIEIALAKVDAAVEASTEAVKEVLVIKGELNKGALKIIKSLTEGVEDEEDKEKISPTSVL